MLPLILDDVLVNFDHDRAIYAARTLKTFAELGHQVMMFTCHQHIVDIFHGIDVEVRMMPPQGVPGRATVLLPELHQEELHQEELHQDELYEEEEEYEEEVLEDLTEEPENEPEVEVAEEEEIEVEQEHPVVLEQPVKKEPEPVRPRVVKRVEIKPKKKIKPRIEYVAPLVSEVIEETEYVDDEPVPGIGWAWFEREPIDRLEDVEDALASIANHALLDDPGHDQDQVPAEVLDRSALGGAQLVTNRTMGFQARRSLSCAVDLLL